MEPIRIDLCGQIISPGTATFLRAEFHKLHEPAPDWGCAHPLVQRQIEACATGVMLSKADLDKLQRRMSFGGMMMYQDANMPVDVIEFYRARDLVARIVNVGQPNE